MVADSSLMTSRAHRPLGTDLFLLFYPATYPLHVSIAEIRESTIHLEAADRIQRIRTHEQRA